MAKYKGFEIKKKKHYSIEGGGYQQSIADTITAARRIAKDLANRKNEPMKIRLFHLYHIYTPTGVYKSSAKDTAAAKTMINKWAPKANPEITAVVVVNGKTIRPNSRGSVREQAAEFLLDISGYANPYRSAGDKLTAKKALNEAWAARNINRVGSDIVDQLERWQSARVSFRKVKK